MRQRLAILGGWTLAVAVAAGQSTPGVRFEEASIRPNNSGASGSGTLNPRAGRFGAQNIPVIGLITYAYRLERFRVLGGPEWIYSERFDVEGVAANRVTGDLRRMVQSLLEERFGLRARLETRRLPTLELVRTRSNGTLGDGLRAAPQTCEERSKAQDPCWLDIRPGNIRARGQDWRSIAAQMSTYSGAERIVVDKTGLTGEFDVTLQWVPEPPPRSDAPAVQSSSSGPTFLQALQEQFGLKLIDAEGDVEVLAIESVSRPSPN